MAVTKVPQSGKMVIKVQTGVGSTGSPVYRLRTFANVQPGATDSDIYAVAQGLVSLQKHTLVDISRQDAGNLINE